VEVRRTKVEWQASRASAYRPNSKEQAERHGGLRFFRPVLATEDAHSSRIITESPRRADACNSSKVAQGESTDAAFTPMRPLVMRPFSSDPEQQAGS
jgi:hypothetical protein